MMGGLGVVIRDREIEIEVEDVGVGLKGGLG